jgi:hypothetical protein
MLYVLEVLGITCAIAYGVYWLVDFTGAVDPDAVVLIPSAVVFLAFPVVLLSVIENGSALAFYSPPVLRSLVRRPHYWLLFHLETLALLGLLVAIVWAGLGDLAFFAALLAPPIAAAYVLIYARLLGRMAWHIGDLDEKRQESREPKNT